MNSDDKHEDNILGESVASYSEDTYSYKSSKSTKSNISLKSKNNIKEEENKNEINTPEDQDQNKSVNQISNKSYSENMSITSAPIHKKMKEDADDFRAKNKIDKNSFQDDLPEIVDCNFDNNQGPLSSDDSSHSLKSKKEPIPEDKYSISSKNESDESKQLTKERNLDSLSKAKSVNSQYSKRAIDVTSSYESIPSDIEAFSIESLGTLKREDPVIPQVKVSTFTDDNLEADIKTDLTSLGSLHSEHAEYTKEDNPKLSQIESDKSSKHSHRSKRSHKSQEVKSLNSLGTSSIKYTGKERIKNMNWDDNSDSSTFAEVEAQQHSTVSRPQQPAPPLEIKTPEKLYNPNSTTGSISLTASFTSEDFQKAPESETEKLDDIGIEELRRLVATYESIESAESLKHRIQKLKKGVHRRDESIEDKHRKIKELQKITENNTPILNDIETRNRELKRELDELEANLEQKKSEVSQLKNEIELFTTRAQNIPALETEISELKDENLRLADEKEIATSKLYKERKSVEKSLEKRGNLAAKARIAEEAIQKTASAKKQAKLLRKKLAELDAENVAIQAENERLRASLTMDATLPSDVAHIAAEISSKERDAAEAERILAEELKEKCAEIENMRKQIHRMRRYKNDSKTPLAQAPLLAPFESIM